MLLTLNWFGYLSEPGTPHAQYGGANLSAVLWW